MASGNVNLRSVNVETGEQHLLWDGFFSSAALNPITGSLLLAVDSLAAQGNPNGQTGLFFIGSANASAQLPRPVKSTLSSGAPATLRICIKL